ncbi:hypothetical protein K474DRAFT_983059 [Panus rudis PR-1116 ss-1]|nr:hypothetical protein K474DRAFT_983059 [Panus rudis PR-1116 ss-1]
MLSLQAARRSVWMLEFTSSDSERISLGNTGGTLCAWGSNRFLGIPMRWDVLTYSLLTTFLLGDLSFGILARTAHAPMRSCHCQTFTTVFLTVPCQTLCLLPSWNLTTLFFQDGPCVSSSLPEWLCSCVVSRDFSKEKFYGTDGYDCSRVDGGLLTSRLTIASTLWDATATRLL